MSARTAAVLVISPAELRDIVCEAVREGLSSRAPEREILTATEVAKMLDIHTKSVAKLVSRDDLPAFRLGREYRFRREDVVTWLEARSTRPGAHTAKHGAVLRQIKGAA